MIRLFGLEGYTGRRIAPGWLIEEQQLVWKAEVLAAAELAQRKGNA